MIHENNVYFSIPPSTEKYVLKLRDMYGNDVDMKIEKRIHGEDGCFYVTGVTHDGKDMTLRFKNGHVEQIIDKD